jgi:hypothetical protein
VELQGAKSDRAAAQMEKAALERQVKQVQSQTGRMTKDLEKKVRPWFCLCISWCFRVRMKNPCRPH